MYILYTYSWFIMCYWFLLYNKVIQFYTYIYIYIYIYIYTQFHILFHCGLSQDIEYSSLCYTVGLCCFSTLGIRVCIYSSQLPIHPSPIPTSLPLSKHESVLYVCQSIECLHSALLLYVTVSSCLTVLCPTYSLLQEAPLTYRPPSTTQPGSL